VGRRYMKAPFFPRFRRESCNGGRRCVPTCQVILELVLSDAGMADARWKYPRCENLAGLRADQLDRSVVHAPWRPARPNRR
jgi:hypothetical protein